MFMYAEADDKHFSPMLCSEHPLAQYIVHYIVNQPFCRAESWLVGGNWKMIYLRGTWGEAKIITVELECFTCVVKMHRPVFSQMT